jgi:hypothetical protein
MKFDKKFFATPYDQSNSPLERETCFTPLSYNKIRLHSSLDGTTSRMRLTHNQENNFMTWDLPYVHKALKIAT